MFIRELRQSIRALRRSPTFTLGAILVMGLGLGLTLTLFNGVHTLLWRPLPFPDSDHLLTVTHPKEMGRTQPISRSMAQALARRDEVAHLGLASGAKDLYIHSEFQTLNLASSRVNSGYFKALSIQPMVGRFFDLEEDSGETTEQRIILTEKAWRTHFGADPGIVNRVLNTPSGPLRVLGVLPGRFKLPFIRAKTDALSPLEWKKPVAGKDSNFIFSPIVRIRPGTPNLTPLIQAMNSVLKTEPSYTFTNLREALAPKKTGVFMLLLGACGFLLLLACANVAGLFLARGLARSREEALRAALGSGPWEAIQRHILEALWITGSASLLALGLEQLGRQWMPELMPELERIGPELLNEGPSLWILALLLSFFTALLLALLPALKASKPDLNRVLQEGSATTSSRQGTWPALLIAAQTALVLALLVGSSLLGRSLAKALSNDPGFPIENLLACRLKPPMDAKGLAWAYEIQKLAQEIPGVQKAALTGFAPFQEGAWQTFNELGGDQCPVQLQPIGPGAMDLLGIPLIAGRNFEQSDADQPVVQLNARAAQAFFKGESPLGRTYNDRNTIIGVVKDTRLSGLDLPPPAIAYTPLSDDFGIHLLIRTPLQDAAFEKLLAARLKNAGSRAVIIDTHSAKGLAFETVRERVRLPLVAGTFSLLGLVLGAMGLTASLSAHLAQSRRTFALKLALGAQPRRILGEILWKGFRPVILGILIGLPLALCVAQMLQNQLYGVAPFDPVAFMGASGILLLVALATTMIPALKTARQSPADALRG